MKKPPPYISLIQSGWIRIEGDLSQAKKNGIKLEGIPFSKKGIYFNDDGPYFENQNLVEQLLSLNDKGVVFGEDYKQWWSPAEFMR